MKVTWNGRSYNWKMVKGRKNKRVKNKSELHLRIREFLKKKYSLVEILEEVFLPGVGLYADFYIPLFKILVEAHGRQHFEYVDHFHKNILNFIASKKNDELKRSWCLQNAVNMIELPYSETEEEWQKRF